MRERGFDRSNGFGGEDRSRGFSILGSELAVTIPYRPDFQRFKAHYSGHYSGASLRALCDLAANKGYVFVGCESSGTNAFFVRNDVATRVAVVSVREGYVSQPPRYFTQPSGALGYSKANRLTLIEDLPLVDVRTGETKKIRELYSLATA